MLAHTNYIFKKVNFMAFLRFDETFGRKAMVQNTENKPQTAQCNILPLKNAPLVPLHEQVKRIALLANTIPGAVSSF
jgi:hypothetical protein